MRVPIRKGGKFTNIKPDPHLTTEKFLELKNKLKRLKEVTRFKLMAEVSRLAEMGDFSENAAYQIAKGKLRGVNQKILELEDQLNKAEIISKPRANDIVSMGHRVTVENNGQEKEYLILGPSEANPLEGIISHQSPMGEALLGKRVGDSFKISSSGKQYKIIKIN